MGRCYQMGRERTNRTREKRKSMTYIFSQDGTLKNLEEHKRFELQRKRFEMDKFERIVGAIKKRKDFLTDKFKS